MPPETVLSFLAPTFFGDYVDSPYWGDWYLWEVCGFVGIAGLVLAFFAIRSAHPQRYLWAGVAGVAVVLALGRYGPLFFLYHIPGFNLFRAPGRFLVLFTLAMAPLVGWGFDRLWNARKNVHRTARRLGIILSVGCGLLIALAFTAITPDSWADVLSVGEVSDDRLASPEFRERTLDASRSALLWGGGFLAAAAAALIAAWRRFISGRVTAAILGGLLCIELIAFGARYVKGRPEANMPWPQELKARVQNHPAYPFRVGSGVLQDTGRARLLGIAHVGGYEPLMLRRYADLFNVAHDQSPDTKIVNGAPRKRHPIYNILGVRMWVRRMVPESPAAVPIALMVTDARRIDDPVERLRFLAGPDLEPRKTVVLEEEAVSGNGGKATLREYASGACTIRADSPAGGYVVFNESWFPGWRASIDGAPAPILRANHLFQAVRVPPGRHEVRFEYSSRFLGLGMALSGLSLLALVGWMLRRRHA